jgi:hypothetical protein
VHSARNPELSSDSRLYAVPPMRIGYLAHLNNGRGSGVVAKLRGQAACWRAAGHQTRFFVATRDADVGWSAGLGERVVERYTGFASRLGTMARLVRAIRGFAPDTLYVRFDIFYPPMVFLPPGQVVVEINTDDLAEFALGGRLRATYNSLTRRLLLDRADALVFVTSELASGASFAGFRARRIVISNGIDLAAYPVLDGPSRGPLTLVFVGGGGEAWQGVDKVLELARRRPDWRFDLVGELNVTDVPPNIRLHGRVERDPLLNILATADVGLGTLALHRKSLSEASPLKLREYVAVGLPVVYGHVDPDIDLLGPLALRISNTATNVVDELDQISTFVEGARGQRIPRSVLKDIAMSSKEAERLRLFESLSHG